MTSLDLLADARAVLRPATSAPMLPLPVKLGGALLWRRADIEVWKAALFDMPPPELVTAQPMEFVTARQLAGELKVGMRTLRRRLAEARAAAAEARPREPSGESRP
jgi:hypothetical protein